MQQIIEEKGTNMNIFAADKPSGNLMSMYDSES